MDSTLTNYEDQYIELQSDKITNLINSPSLFSSIKVTAQSNCCNCFSEVIVIDFTPGSTTQGINFTNNSIRILPEVLGLSSLEDSITNITIEYRPIGGGSISNETFCGLVDVNMKCRVAQYMKNLLSRNNKDDESLLIHLQYFGLKEGSNCNCNCDLLCELFEEINRVLSNYNVDSNCGC